MSKENNKVDINKHETDIDILKKQNVNDLLSIKELYSKLEELGEKITQIKYIDNTLVKKIKKEYEKLKKIILDENVQVNITNDIETINKQQVNITNDIETINTQQVKITNDIETINTQQVKITNDIESINTQQVKSTNDIKTINTQMEHKANKNDIVDWINLNSKITNLEDISADVKNAIEGVEGATLYIPFGNYKFNPFKISNTNNLTIVCDGKLILNNVNNLFAIEFENCNNLTLEMLNCEFNNSNVVGIVLTDCENYKINCGNLTNIGTDNSNYSSDGMLIRGKSHNGRIRDITINGVKSSTFASGIHLDKYNDVLPCNTVIDGVLIQDISPLKDSDGIKILNGTDEDCNLVVSNSTFVDCRKRALKFQAKGCKSIGNTMIWNERGFVPIDFQRGYGKSIGDTIITNWEGNSKDIQNGYFRALTSISNGYVDISDMTYKINSDTTWLKNVNQSGGIIEFNKLVNDSVSNVTINNINGGGGGRLFITNSTANITNVKIDNIDVELFNSQLFDTDKSVITDFRCKIKIKISKSLTFINSSFTNSIIEIDVNNTGNINTNKLIDLTSCKLIIKNSTRIADNIITGNNTTWELPQIPSSYALSQATWVQRCRIGDICKKTTPTIDENGILTGWICTQIADDTLTRGVWKPTYITIN